MNRSQPDKLHDELDALLDGRPVELTDELAPLVEAAGALRGELAAYELDPEVADRHLERVLGSPANVVPMPTRPQPSGWDVRRRMVAVALAAALVLAPATMASAAALPGQAMYPFKLAIEQLRLAAVQWSPSREASERTRVADERLNEVQALYKLEMYSQLPTAIRALKHAVVEARRAVEEAQDEGESVSSVVAKLSLVQQVGGQVLKTVAQAARQGSVGLSKETAKEIQVAVQEASPTVSPSPTTTPTTAPKGGGAGNPTQPTSTTPAGQGPGTTSPASQTTTPQTTNPPEPSTSQPTTTTAPTTTVPPTTTEPTTTTDVNPTVGSIGDDAGGAAGRAGAGDPAPPGYAPPTTGPPPSGP